MPRAVKDQLVAFQVAITLEPSSPNSEIKTARDVVEGQVLPNIRDSWTPDETFFKRLRKPDLRIRLLLRKVKQTLHQREGNFGGQVTTTKNSEFSNVSTFKLHRAAALAEWRQLLSA